MVVRPAAAMFPKDELQTPSAGAPRHGLNHGRLRRDPAGKRVGGTPDAR